jgi:hypothetical protein
MRKYELIFMSYDIIFFIKCYWSDQIREYKIGGTRSKHQTDDKLIQILVEKSDFKPTYQQPTKQSTNQQTTCLKQLTNR